MIVVYLDNKSKGEQMENTNTVQELYLVADFENENLNEAENPQLNINTVISRFYKTI